MGDEERSKHRETERSSGKHRHRRDEDRHRRKKRRRHDHDDRDERKTPKADDSLEKSLAEQFDEDMWEEKPQDSELTEQPKIERQSWMTESKTDINNDPFGSFLGAIKEKKPIEKPKQEGPVMSSRELNPDAFKPPSSPSETEEDDKYKPPTYTIGDSGSSWRMMKLKNLYAAAKEAMRPVEDLAIERMGSLRAFDEAREEEIELERRKRDRRGEGVMKVKVTGELYLQRLAKQLKQSRRQEKQRQQEQPPPIPSNVTADSPPITQSDLNKLQAALLRAEMTSSPTAAKLAEEYSLLVEKFNTQQSAPEIIRLPTSHSTLLPHLSREQSKSETEMTIEDMVKEERATKRLQTVDRISRDRKFKNDLEYMDENAERLAAIPKRKELDLKSMSIQEYKKQQRIMETCPLCYKDDGKLPLAPVISLGTRTYLSLPTEPELTNDGAMIVPIRHARNLADCDDDEWEEIRVPSQFFLILIVELSKMFNANVCIKRPFSIILRRCISPSSPPSPIPNRHPNANTVFQSSPCLLYPSSQHRRIRMGNTQTHNPHKYSRSRKMGFPETNSERISLFSCLVFFRGRNGTCCGRCGEMGEWRNVG